MIRFKPIQLANIFGIGDRNSPGGRALLRERYASLQRQIPLLYLLICVNYLGLSMTMTGNLLPPFDFATVIFGLMLIRLVYWYRHRNRKLSDALIYVELRTTLCLAAVISLSFCAFALFLFDHVDSRQQHLVVFFATLAWIGCGYSLSSFPSAARLPLILMGVPIGIRLLVSGSATFVILGASTLLIAYLTLRMLNAHHQSFRRLVESRSEQIRERGRARVAEAEARKVADTDHLTEMPNRRAFLRELAEAHRLPPSEFIAVAMVDLDGFKPINDTFGHGAGDLVLKQVGRRLQEIAGPDGVVARMGGDEFALLQYSVGTQEEAESLGQRICGALGESIRIEKRDLRISGSCGISISKSAEREPLAQIAEGDSALYVAKQKGPGCWAVFDPAMQEEMRRRSRLEQMLRDPEIEQQLEMVFQPIFRLDTLDVIAFEALARWHHPILGTVSPDEFIRAAEQINIVDDLTNALLAKALRQAGRWPSPISLSFNLSARQLCSRGSSARLLSIIRGEGFDPNRLQMEITETAFLGDFETARENLQALRESGIRIALDDFGAGHASISYLREMQFDSIKLDGSLLQTASTCTSSHRLLRGIVDLCRSIRTPCVAEHIESEAHLRVLQLMNCPEGQGNFLSEPLSPEAALDFLELRATARRGAASKRLNARDAA